MAALVPKGWTPEPNLSARHRRVDEPQGLGAVVVDAKGRQWVHFGNGCWIKSVPNAQSVTRSWADISPVRVLSPGVPPEATP